MSIELMRRFYELFPYPKRPLWAFPKLDKHIPAHFGFWQTPQKDQTLSDLRQLEDKQNILLCGCGTDEPSLFYFLHENVNIEAMDLSQHSLNLARRRIHFWDRVRPRSRVPQLKFLKGDASELVRKRKNFYHHIQCFGVLHHQRNPETLLKNMSEALKPTGTIRFMVYAHRSRQLERALQKRFAYKGTGFLKTHWQTVKLKLWKLGGVLCNKSWATQRLRYLRNNTRLFADALMHPSDPGLSLEHLCALLKKHNLQMCYLHTVCPTGVIEAFGGEAESAWKAAENWDKRSQLLANITFVAKKKTSSEKSLQ